MARGGGGGLGVALLAMCTSVLVSLAVLNLGPGARAWKRSTGDAAVDPRVAAPLAAVRGPATDGGVLAVAAEIKRLSARMEALERLIDRVSDLERKVDLNSEEEVKRNSLPFLMRNRDDDGGSRTKSQAGLLQPSGEGMKSGGNAATDGASAASVVVVGYDDENLLPCFVVPPFINDQQQTNVTTPRVTPESGASHPRSCPMPVSPRAGLQCTLLSKYPRIVHLRNFMSARCLFPSAPCTTCLCLGSDADVLLDLARAEMQRRAPLPRHAAVRTPHFMRITAKDRGERPLTTPDPAKKLTWGQFLATPQQMKHPVVLGLAKRVALLLHVPLSHLEPVEPGYEYPLHSDGNTRQATVYVFLSTILMGGEVEFVNTSPTVSISSVKGDAVLWYNLNRKGAKNGKAMHWDRAPLGDETRWVACFFVRKKLFNRWPRG